MAQHTRLHLRFALYVLGFGAFVLLMAWMERLGLSRSWIGLIFMLSTVVLYAGIGVACRTSAAQEYYVAGRSVPGFYNGMAMSADWMSAATFISLAGTLYLSGYMGLAYIMGWTGGFVLLAIFLAPYLRAFGQFTVPDFLAARYDGVGGHLRTLVVMVSLLVSFIYVVAQLYGVGLITARLTGLPFEIGVMAGLGGVLVSSLLGGMRSITWTQVVQAVILLAAYLTPVVWMSVQQTGSWLPQFTYGQQLQALTEKEKALRVDPHELEVVRLFQSESDSYAARLDDVPYAMRMDREAAVQQLLELRKSGAPLSQQREAERNLQTQPRKPEDAQRRWEAAQRQADDASRPLGGLPPHALPYAGHPDGNVWEQERFGSSRANFLALILCLMVGTAGLPHVLVRSYTTPTVREARSSVAWCLFFVLLVYLTAPALAVMVKLEIFQSIVGQSFERLPEWMVAWNRVDPSLLSVRDINGDGVLQLGEINMSGDIVTLAAPAIAGLPFVVSALVAAGGLAAALSTADGLLLTISSALSHDLYYKVVDPQVPSARRVAITKAWLLLVALTAAFLAAQKPADILFLVAAAFSLAGAAFFPALVLGIFWKRANTWGALSGIVVGVGVTLFYMATTQPWLRGVFGVTGPVNLWWDIQPVSAGVFGIPLGFITIVLVSCLTAPPSAASQALVDRVRHPQPARKS